MAGFHIPASAILTFGDKRLLTIYIPEGRICPFRLTKPVDIILMAQKDYEKNKQILEPIITDTTKILFYA